MAPILAIVVPGLWFASEWWEKSLASPLGSPVVSPNGCYRLETFKPLWLLPKILHRKADPNEDIEPQWLPWWEYPGFYRLFDNRSGQLLGESNIYDLEQASGDIDWGVTGSVYVGMIFVGPNAKDCIFDRPTQDD
ncbi:hypothetical protein [Pseudomonas sp. zfem002]|uniref:hypothetical protein n=1 Tax=Pseudomonas sp. zfem002 TaxID=3078197 RepID=UPI0029282A19|nr:hypothetical protein [Pseudomonas sp. zfem002]MDU9394008.1 hypothetical protein [Pseudomonas sp. zfem002]